MASGPGYETSDVRARPVVLAGALLFAFAGAVGASMLAFLHAFDPPAGERPPAVVAPGPDSPAYPIEDWRGVHAEAERRLSTPAWIDRPGGVVRVPIQRAMALVVERGLAVRPTAPGPRGVAR